MSEFKKYFNEKFFDKTIFKEKGENIDGLLSNERDLRRFLWNSKVYL